MTPLAEWLKAHPQVLAGLGLGSIAMLVGSALLLPVLVARLPADYFVRTREERIEASPHPILRLTLSLLKNVLGTILLLAGIAMLFLPGQGILTILIGLGLVEFPGKRALEIRIVRMRSVQTAIGWLRRRADRPPLLLPDPHGEGEVEVGEGLNDDGGAAG